MKTFIRVLAAGALVAALGLVASCAPEASTQVNPNAIVQVGSTNPPVNLNNVAGGSSGITEALYRNVYEPLLALEDDGTIVPTLAESYEASADGLTYTFTLRSGVTFHDGSALTPEDVKFSFERVLAPASKAARKSDLAVIDRVEVAGENAVAVVLKQKAQSFPYFATYVWIHKAGTEGNEATANGTGPYKLGDYQAGVTLSLVRNDAYWGSKAKNGGVTFTYYKDAAAQSNALLSGQIDLVTNVATPEQLKTFEGKSGYVVTEGKSTTKQVLAFNDARKPFTDVRVRQALSKAIDKAAILKAAWDHYGQLIGSFVPPQDPWYEDLTGVHAYDPEAAKKLLAEAGLAQGFSFALVTPNTEVHQITAQAVQSDLAKIGVTVEIKVIDPAAWYEIVYQNRDYDATLQEHVNDRDLVWYGNPKFYWQYDNPQVQQWVKDAQAVDTPEQQVELYKKIGRTIAEEAASAWIFLYPQLRVSKDTVTGYPVNGKNSSFFVANIEKIGN